MGKQKLTKEEKEIIKDKKKNQDILNKFYETRNMEDHPWRKIDPKYKIGDWIKIERGYEKNYIPENADDEFNHFSYMGYYKKLFEQTETKKNGNATHDDYFNLYNRILDRITGYIFLDNLYLLTCGESLQMVYEDMEVAYENEKKKLDKIFKEYISTVKKTKNTSLGSKKKVKND